MNLFSHEVIEAARAHARTQFPKESCGAVVGGLYRPMTNVAKSIDTHEQGNPDCGCQLCSFAFDPKAALKLGKIDAIIHSHPNGPLFPSQADMEGQVATNVPWAIIALDQEDGVFRYSDPIVWGATERPALLGRQFVHGVTDCYSLIRDTYAMGKEKLAELDITHEWPFEPIELVEGPRSDGWWDNEGQDLYLQNYKRAGFREIAMDEARPGDVFLCAIASPGRPASNKLSHGGILISRDQIMHHLPLRVSRREPAGLWARAASMWIRYEGPGANA